MAISKQDLTRIQGKFAEKYGEQMDEWSVILFSEIHENFQLFELKVKELTLGVENAGKEIKGKRQHIHFKDEMEAFGFGVGVTVPVCVAVVILAILLFLYKSTTSEYEQIQNVIDTYENAPYYRYLMQNGTIIERNNQRVLVLKPFSKNKGLLTGQGYIFDSEGKQVLVPLGIR